MHCMLVQEHRELIVGSCGIVTISTLQAKNKLSWKTLKVMKRVETSESRSHG